MTANHNENERVLRARTTDLGLRLDPITGLPLNILFRQGADEVEVPFAMTVTLETDGQEVARAPFGLAYVDTTRLSMTRRRDAVVNYRLGGVDETYTVSTALGQWIIEWDYTFREQHPRLEIGFTVRSEAALPALLRNVRIEIALRLPELSGWLIEAPGNHLRPGIGADALSRPVAISPAGGVDGSTGLIALHQPSRRQVVTLWPFSRTEIGAIMLEARDAVVHCTLDTRLAGRIQPGTSLRYGTLYVDAFDGTWAQTRDTVPDWYGTLGVAVPHDRAAWIETASIFEVQLGSSVFRSGYQYAPYPTVHDLHADLGRIKGLGYDLLQIMPRQPYPSYNVHDYADITTSYGDEDELRALVAACHALGMRVILDILLHGVIDQEVMAQTVARVKSGPFFDRLDETTQHMVDFQLDTAEVYHIAWSRHILDFEPYWHAGALPRHPLAEQHPEWFMRDSAQQIIGIYTKAFDVANPAWQAYFIQSAEDLVRRLDIDGFRFDAPTYNDLPNWSTATEQRASYSALGCLHLFQKLRPRLKRMKPDIILYTEPSGVLFRQTMDITYNYDEQWLIPAVLLPSDDALPSPTSVRNGRELAAWFRDRNAVLPRGSLITHHIDSHDTFWWPLPGYKWRREQFGEATTRALMAVFALSGGAYMTFVGGEHGIEDEVRRVHRLRKSLPELGSGMANYEAVTVDHDAVYALVRQQESAASVVLVNLSAQRVMTTCALDTSGIVLSGGEVSIYDAWNDEAIKDSSRYTWSRAALEHIPVSLDAFQTRLLVLRPVHGDVRAR